MSESRSWPADVFSRVGVVGAGSWGTALAVHLARGGVDVTLWCRSREQLEELQRGRNERYLEGVELPDGVRATNQLGDLAEHACVLMVVPSHTFRDVLRDLLVARKNVEASPLVIVSGTKGIETETLARMSCVCFEEGLRSERELHYAVLSGPSFAEELVAGMPTASVVAAEDAGLAAHLQDVFSSATLRLYSTTDVPGVEIGGAAKNVVAIAAGLVSGLGLGHNTLAALMTRGLHEVTRLGIACGGRQSTLSGLAGLGDLVLTCTGGLSRNRRTGVLLAEGHDLNRIEAELGHVAEGVKTSLALSRLAKSKGIEMPITEQMVAVMYEGKSPRRAVEELMTRDLKMEAEL